MTEIQRGPIEPPFTILPADDDGAPPLYRTTQARLREAIARGDFAAGDALPAERVLAAQLGVSIGTLRKGIDPLVAEGLLVRRQGRGTFVAEPGHRDLRRVLVLVDADGTTAQHEPALRSFARSVPALADAPALGIAEADPVHRLRVLSRIDGLVMLVEDIVVPAMRASRLDVAHVGAVTTSLYTLYQQQAAMLVVRVADRVGAAAPPADIAVLLDLPSGAPALRIERIAFDGDEHPCELRTGWADARRWRYATSR